MGNRRFQPGLWPTLAVLVLLPAFLWLGNWQLERAAFKRERLAAHQAAAPEDVLPMAKAIRDGYDAASGVGVRHVSVRGAYDGSARHVLLEQMSHAGKAGYQVLTPMQLRDAPGTWVMVNRGWIERDYAAAKPPALPALSTEPREFSGVLRRLPVPGLRVKSTLPAAAELTFPLSMLYPDVTQLERVLGGRVYDGMVLLEPNAADGFLRAWQPRIDGPQKHMGYAVQWFSFAGTLLVLYLWLNLKRVGRELPALERAAG